LPAVLIILACTVILVIGIRESATTNAILVGVKVGVVLFVIAVGYFYINSANWTSVPVVDRVLPEETAIPDLAEAYAKDTEKLEGDALKERKEELSAMALAKYKIEQQKKATNALLKDDKISPAEAEKRINQTKEKNAKNLPKTKKDKEIVESILVKVRKEAPDKVAEKWGMLGWLGLNRWLVPIDDATRSPFTPYGLSGIIFGAALVFFAYIGFDAISTHSEEAKKPQRDVPIGILASLAICTVLYIAVSAVITGMEPYPEINRDAAVAAAFHTKAEVADTPVLKAAALLIATGALAGLTSVLLITFLSQARIFLAMARDGLLPPRVFGAIHERFRTPHLSTMLTGGVIAIVAAFTPIEDLEGMVNIGTLMAFIIVCAAVWILRVKEPHAHRPFRCPALYIVAPLGILVNFIMMLFLPPVTWLRLLIWLAIGLVIYFGYGLRHSTIGKELAGKA
jgi:APA family basic amino acid/polyamine antiporter